jgi:hypothetical protein
MCKVTLIHIRETIFSVKNQLTLHILRVYFNLMYTACKARPSYFHLRPLLLYNIVYSTSHNRQNFKKEFWALKL